MTRFKRILKKTAKALIALALVLLAANGLLNYYWGRQIEARLAAIRATGQPTSFADLQSQSVPDRDNAAPIYKRAFKAMSEPAARRDMEALYPILYSQSETASPADWAKAKSAFARCDRIIALIEEAQSKPVCQFSAYPTYNPQSQESLDRFNALSNEYFQQLSGLRGAVRLLCAKMILSAREGRTRDVVRDTRSALKFNDAFGRDPMLIEYLVSVAITNIALANMRQALGYCEPSESELRQLDNALSHINVPELYKHAIEGERVYFLMQNYEFRKAGVRYPFRSGDTLAYLDFMSKHLESTRMNYSAALSKGLVGPRAADSVPFYSTFTKILAPVLARAAGARYKCEAEIACGRTFLALRAYKARFGQYPRTLRDLQPGIGWKLPEDPFTGKDLVYKQVGGGFVLYSVGYDLKDNGGTALQSRGQTEPGGDIVWKIAR